MQITFDTNSVSTEDRDLILKVLGVTPGEDDEQETKPAPAAKRAAPARRGAAKKAATPPPAETEDEDEEDAEDEEEEEAQESSAKAKGPTLDDAIARATELVGEGRKPDVQMALAELGKKRVSELKTAKEIAAFLTSLED